MKSAVAFSILLVHAVAAPGTEMEPNSVFESSVELDPSSKIDELVYGKLQQLGIQPAHICSDAVFVRRVYLDVIGTLPTADEAQRFIDDPAQDKRRVLIDGLLEREEFADYWAMKWGDILRIKAEFPVNLWPNAAQAYHRWIRASIAENKPYDKFVRELLTSSGSNFRVGPVNFYRAIQNRTPEGIATAVALAFMGSRTASWPPEHLNGTAAFFSQIGYKPTSEWKEELVFWDPLRASTVPGNFAPGQDAIRVSAGKPAEAPPVAAPLDPGTLPTAIFPDGTQIQLQPDRDPRQVFADWLITPDNPWFTRSIVNRVWAWLLARGVIHEPDDIREDNPPSNPELLDHLQHEFIQGGYDLKQLYRLILNSQTYQLSSIAASSSPGAEANFASYPLRRLDAEVLIDAINQITGTSDLYTSAIPEPFTYIPQDKPAIALPDGSITSPFLALFGRSARATGMENERQNKPVPAQALHMLNSSHIQLKLDQGAKIKALLNSTRPHDEMVEDLYLTILSRRPTPDELGFAAEYLKSTRSKREAAIDISWALINSTEFLYRH